MQRDSQFQLSTGTEQQYSINEAKYRSDLAILAFMARRLRYLLTQPTTNSEQPLLYHVQERHQRAHRIAMYQPLALQQWQASDLPFVGFISHRRELVEPFVLEDIQTADQTMLIELKHNPGLLSYSSLELRPGYWYNLVLMHDERAKEHFRQSKTHAYAAYDLSPRYYEWIRLHHGLLMGGLALCKFQLGSTRYYFFADQNSSMIYNVTHHERIEYQPCKSSSKS